MFRRWRPGAKPRQQRSAQFRTPWEWRRWPASAQASGCNSCRAATSSEYRVSGLPRYPEPGCSRNPVASRHLHKVSGAPGTAQGCPIGRRERSEPRNDYSGRAPRSLVATSLELPKTLTSRMARLAKRAGESPHAFMSRSLEIQVEAVEPFESFVADAACRPSDARMRAGVRCSRDVEDRFHELVFARGAAKRLQKP